MHRHHYAVCSALSVLITLFALQWWWPTPLPPEAWIGTGILFLVSGILIVSTKTRMLGQLGLAVGLGVALALGSFMRIVHETSPKSIDGYAHGGQQSIRGKLIEVEDGGTFLAFTIESQTIAQSGSHLPISGNVRVTTRWINTAVAYGDILEIRGNVQPLTKLPMGFSSYLQSQGILATMQAQEVRLYERGKPSLLRFLYSQKMFMCAAMQRALPAPHAAMLSGLLLGMRSGIPKNIEESFRSTGLTHVLAISGYNITIVILAIESLLFFLPRRWKVLPSIIVITLFTFLTGASASAVRAAIMGGLGLVALHAREQSHRTILWALTAMALWNPAAFWWDSGLHLSFLAVTGLLAYGKYFQQCFKPLPPLLRETLAMTFSAQIATAPWIAYRFQSISLIAPLSNLLILPLIPSVMLTGFLGLLGAVIWAPLGIVTMLPCLLLLVCMLNVIAILAAFPFASIPVPEFPFVAMCSVYALLAIAWWRHRFSPFGSPDPLGNPHVPSASPLVKVHARRAIQSRTPLHARSRMARKRESMGNHTGTGA